MDRTDDNNTAAAQACTAAANNDCSLRGAIITANASVGVADVIHVPAGTYTLTIPGSTEDAAATGDLDITDTVTIQGDGSANTIIQAGTSNTNGIDKVFSVNPGSEPGNASATFDGVTIRFGMNTNPNDQTNFSHIGAGIDFFGRSGTLAVCGTEKLKVINSVITENTVANMVPGLSGAGLSADNGHVEITNSTISNNKTTTQSGGGISHTGTTCTLTMTNSTVFNNEAHGGASGEGGGIFVRQNVNGTVMIHSSTISNNTSESRAGGIKLEAQGALNTTIDRETRITGNTSSGTGTGISEGGGVDISTNNDTTTLKDVTITGNHANDTSGGAPGGGKGGGIFLNLGTLDVSLSRIAGNTAPTGSGLFLATTAGTVTAVNNWWGCDEFPDAPGCDTVSGMASVDPRLDLVVTATPSMINSGGTSSVKADVSKNSAGAAVTPVVLNGLTITFGATNGTMSRLAAPLASFMATSTYTNTSCPSSGPATAMATLDDGTDTAGITINCNSDLAITKTDNPDPVQVGDNLTYTMTVTNNGPSNATVVTMTDILPAGVTFVSTSASQGSCSGTTVVVCGLGNLANGASATVTLVVTPTAAGTLANVATVTGHENDPTPANNSDTEQTMVNAAPAADLVVTKSDSPDPVQAGNNLTYTMTVSNTGPSNATGVKMMDTLPGGVTFVAATPSQGSCTGTSTVTCNLGSLTASATATVTLKVKPTAAGTITNTANVTGSPTDPTPANNSATQQTTVNSLLCDGKTPTIVGTPGNDTINGTNGNDVIHGLGGNDTINGGNGDDVICGGDGNDILNGDNGTDRLFGENGNDTLNGDNGVDALDGGANTDTCNGGNGSDTAAACESVTSVP